MAEDIRSIGATGRNYATITLWEADLEDAVEYTSGDDAIGECYDDGDFVEHVGLAATAAFHPTVELRPASGHEHDGTAGSGIVVKPPSSQATHCLVTGRSAGIIARRVKGLEFDGDYDSTSYGINRPVYASNGFIYFERLLVHNYTDTSGNLAGLECNNSSGDDIYAISNIVYDITMPSSGGVVRGIFFDTNAASRVRHVYNNTVYNNTNRDGDAKGIEVDASTSGSFIYNNIAIDNDIDITGKGSHTHENNISSDLTADGTNSIASVAAADTFVSTVAGFEDLRLKEGSVAIGAGQDLGAGYEDAIGFPRDDRPAWSIGAFEGPTTITRSIGATGRDYSTVYLWVADKADTSIYLEGDHAVGECYADSPFTHASQVQISVGSLLATIHLTAAVGERHDGTFGTGVQFTQNAADYMFGMNTNGIVSWLSVEQDSTVGGQFESKTATEADRPIIRNCMLQGTGTNRKMVNATNTCISVENTVLCDSQNNAIFASGFPSRIQIINCTGYNNGTYQSRGGFGEADNARVNTWNSISFANGDDFKNIDPAGNLSDTFENCISGDTSSSTGTNNVQNAVAADLFVSTTGGSYDFHLLSTASDAIGAGQDKGADYAIDIDGDDRTGETWDIGADQYVSTGSNATSDITLDDVTVTSAAASVIVGDTSVTLDDVTTASAAAVLVDGQTSVTLDDVTVTSAGSAQAMTDGTLSVTLDDVTTASAATVLVDGQTAVTLDGVTVTSDGAAGVVTTATAAITLDDVTLSSAGTVGLDGSADITLDGVTTASAAAVAVDAVAGVQLDGVTVSSSSSLSSNATVSVTLDGVTSSSAAESTIEGATSVTLDGVTITAFSGGVNALAVTLDDVTASSAATALVDGQTAVTLDDVTASSAAESTIAGVSTITLDDVISAGQAISNITASGAITLDGVTISAAGGTPASAAVSIQLDGVVISSASLISTQLRLFPNELFHSELDLFHTTTS